MLRDDRACPRRARLNTSNKSFEIREMSGFVGFWLAIFVLNFGILGLNMYSVRSTARAQ